MEGFWKDSTVIAPVAGYAVNTNVAQAPITQMISSNKAQLVASVTELGKWATMSKWAQAAEVWAWVAPGEKGKGKSVVETFVSTSGNKMTANAFSQLGIKGIKSPTSVLAYWEMWQFAIEQGWAKPSVIGQLATLPVVEWDEAKDLLTNGPASAKVPAEPKPAEVFGFKLGETLEDVDIPAAIQLVNELVAKIEAKLAQGNVNVDGVPVAYTKSDKGIVGGKPAPFATGIGGNKANGFVMPVYGGEEPFAVVSAAPQVKPTMMVDAVGYAKGLVADGAGVLDALYAAMDKYQVPSLSNLQVAFDKE